MEKVHTAPKSKGVAAALSIFLGGLGIQKFYLDKPGQGILCVLFSWTLIPALIGLVEGLMIVFTSDEKWHKLHG